MSYKITKLNKQRPTLGSMINFYNIYNDLFPKYIDIVYFI